MIWIKKYRRIWRIVIILLLVVAFLGPWTFDLTWVPPNYSCSSSNIRLNDNFCGVPLSGTWLYRWVVGGFIYASTGLVTGELVFTEWIREILFSPFIFLFLLPIFSTLLLILRGDYPRRQVFTITAWALAIGMDLFWGLNNYPKLFWIVWGIWLYIALAISTLILEILVILSNHKDSEVLTDGEYVLHSRIGSFERNKKCHG